MKQKRINLNADLGESFGPWKMGNDSALLQIVKSANVACGFHAGDPLVMQHTVRLCLVENVSIGAHPSFPDLQGFGRRVMVMPAKELEAALIYQIGALQAIALAEGASVSHVKPHGALHNVACADEAVATTIINAVNKLDANLPILVPPYSFLAKVAEERGHPVRYEVFADRAYMEDGQLVPRSQPGAVLHDPKECVDHVMQMLNAQAIVTLKGSHLPCRIDSICVHGDGPQAIESAIALREALASRDYLISTLPELKT